MSWNSTTNIRGPEGTPATVEDCYPKKTVYLTTGNKNPNELFGFGTWVFMFERDNIKHWKRTE